MDRQILWDCHMHSSFSADSDTPMEVMIHRAVETGLQGITFTEHLDPDYPVTPDNLDFSLDIPAYKEKLAELSDIYKDKIQVRFGIELGLQMHLREYFDSLLSQTPFDFVIGSSHLVHGYDPYYPEFLKDVRNFYVIWNILNPFLKTFPHMTDLTFTDILIMLSVMVLTRTGNILTDGIKIFWMRF